MTKLTLELDTDKATAPVIVAVRKILKLLWRTYQIRVTRTQLDEDMKRS